MRNTEPRLHIHRDPETRIHRGRCNTELPGDCHCFRPGGHDGRHECHCERYPGSTHGIHIDFSRTLYEAK